MKTRLPAPADLRAELARRQVLLCPIASRRGGGPVLLRRGVRGRGPVPAAMAENLAARLDTWQGGR